MYDDTVYRPSEWGKRFHARTEDWVMGGGASGGGKSHALRADPLEQIWVEHQRMLGNHPHPFGKGESRGRALLLRRELGMLKDNIAAVRRICNSIDPGYRWSEADLTATLSSGYQYQLGHMKDFYDWEKYQGTQYTWLGIDELTQFDEEPVTAVGSWVRTTDPVLRHMLRKRAMTNPLMRRAKGDTFSVKDPHWVRRKFVDPSPEGNVIITYRNRHKGKIFDETCVYLPATVEDNPDPIFRETQLANLAKLKPWMRKALLEGDWYFSPGSYFTEWDRQRHVTKPYRIPPDWPVWRSMDWGYQTHGCIHWYTYHPDDIIFVIYELTFRKKSVPEVAALCRQIEEKFKFWPKGRHARSKISGPADTQLWEQRGEMGLSKAEQFIMAGMNWFPADKSPGSRQSGAMRISERLAREPEPGLIIFDRCKDLIRTLPAIPTDPDDSECPEDGGEDHHFDSLRYGLTYGSRKRPKRIDDEPEEEEDRRPLPPRQSESNFGYWS